MPFLDLSPNNLLCNLGEIFESEHNMSCRVVEADAW